MATFALLLGFASATPAQVTLRAETVITVNPIKTPPLIDGKLDDDAWSGPPQIRELTMAFPYEGRAPSHDTEVWIGVTDRGLYLAVRCYDDPAEIRATQMTQDANMLSDDRINILIDPFDDERNAYFFQINPLGTRGESLSGQDFSNFRPEWDTIWFGDSRIDETGWTTEVMIPFQSVPLNQHSDTWGFEVERNLPRTGERDRWANWSRNKMMTDPQNIGTLRGMRNASGRGIDIKPVFSGVYERNRVESDTDREGNPGLDVFYRPTSSVTAALTLNTDFSDAPVDERIANFTRFATFFPETRDFFLQDAGIFDFGGLSQNGSPFFSRRIGLVDGGIVDLDTGVKTTGRVGDVVFGALHTRMGEDSRVGASNLSVARVKLNVLEASQIGAIFTEGDPRDEINNTVVGADFLYRTARFRGDKLLRGNLWFQRSQSSGVSGREAAFGAKLEYPNDRVNFDLGYTEIQENFDPRLGFVNRRGFRAYEGSFRYRIRPESPYVDRVDFGGSFSSFRRREGGLDSERLTLNLIEVANATQDRILLQYFRMEDRPLEGFFPHPDAYVPAGTYDYDALKVTVGTSISRPVSGQFEVGWGDFYDGTLVRSKATIELRPSPHFFASVFYEQSDGNFGRRVAEVDGERVEAPGDFTQRIVRAQINVNFTPTMSWLNTIQYDNLSDTIGINSRFRWEIDPGNEFFVILNQGYDIDRSSIVPTVSQLTAKLSWTFRF